MSWYYASSNERHGPVAATALLELYQQQKISPQTLVWSEGLNGWVPFQEVHRQLQNAAANPDAVIEPGSIRPVAYTRCAECGNLFDESFLLMLEGHRVCPTCKPVLVQKLLEGVPAGGKGMIWRKGRQLVITRDAELPARCIKCNHEAENHRLKRAISWHHPAFYLLILFPGLLIYVIVAMIARKRATLHVNLCGVHYGRRKRMILSSVLSFVFGVVLAFAAIAATSDEVTAICGILSPLLILSSIVLAVVVSNLIAATRIDHHYIHISGCGADFRNQFPEWRN